MDKVQTIFTSKNEHTSSSATSKRTTKDGDAMKLTGHRLGEAMGRTGRGLPRPFWLQGAGLKRFRRPPSLASTALPGAMSTSYGMAGRFFTTGSCLNA